MKELYRMLGYKLFKEKDDGTIHMIRIVDVKMPFKQNRKVPTNIIIFDYDKNDKVNVKLDDIKGYTPLEPDGVFTAAIVGFRDNKGQMVKDVICTGARYIDVKLKEIPYVICRQNVIDVYYSLFLETESNDMVGMSVNRDTCPAGLDYRLLLASEILDHFTMINFYRNDTLEDILDILNTGKYDEVLNTLYIRHCKHINRPELFMMKDHMGWCKDLETLLKTNNFDSDLNQMLGIAQVLFDIKPYIIEKELIGKPGEMYDSVTPDLMAWLSSVYRVNITDITILEYDHDIDILEFKDSKYFFIRDINNTLYLLVYNENGELYEKDLIEKEKEQDFSTKFRLGFYNKYNNINMTEKKDSNESAMRLPNPS